MSARIRFLGWSVVLTTIIVFSPIMLQSTNLETRELLRIGSNGTPAQQKHVVIQNMSSMPMAFTENRGQWDEQALFRANAGGATMWFAREGTYYQFARRIPGTEVSNGGRQMSTPLLAGSSTSAPAMKMAYRDRFDHEPDSIEQLVIKASFIGANPNPVVIGEEEMEYKCNYFLGNNPSAWRTDVPNYRAVRFKEIYPGIDLKYYGNGRQMEYDFIVAPGADYLQIRIAYDGCNSLTVNNNGELSIETEWGSIIKQKPLIYQLDQGTRIPLEGNFAVSADHSFGFTLGENYNPNLPLIIDPVVLVYSTYLGDDDEDKGFGIAVDGNGNAYVTGLTSSSNFPTQNPYQTDRPNRDAYVTKLNASGNGLIYSTYLGGDDKDGGSNITIDGGGNAYVVGTTSSSNFPTQNPYQTDRPNRDVFVTKLNASGNGLIYSTYLGGDRADDGLGIAVDASGSAYITGETESSDFPTLNPYQTDQTDQDVFVAKLSIGGNELIYSTYLGGDDHDKVGAIVVDGNSNAYITGQTESSDFPTQNPYQTNQPDEDAFVTKLNASGNGLVYSTYLGGDGDDGAYGIAVDASGNAYVAGTTSSSNFPTQDPYQTHQSGDDVFVARLSIAGNELIYSTYLGGNHSDWGSPIAVDASGNAYITGTTLSSDFPTQDPYQTDQPNFDVFITKLNGAGIGLVYSTYLGGDDEDAGLNITIDGSGNAYVVGTTSSSNFPTQNPFQTNQPDRDIFVAKLAFDQGNSIFEEFDEQALASFSLYQNHPNPFNTSTVISFQTHTPGTVELEIYNILGQQIFEQQLETQAPGPHTFRWNGCDQTGKEIPSGIYFYRVTTDEVTQTRKMVLLK